MTNTNTMTPDKAMVFLLEMARYFESRPTNGDDQAHWSNVYNADNCRKIAVLLHPKPIDPSK